MHRHLVYIYRNNQNMTAIGAVRPNVILGQQYLCSPEIETSIFISCQNLEHCRKSILFLLGLNHIFKEIFAKEKTGRTFSVRDGA
jgi:hypothetical protein